MIQHVPFTRNEEKSHEQKQTTRDLYKKTGTRKQTFYRPWWSSGQVEPISSL